MCVGVWPACMSVRHIHAVPRETEKDMGMQLPMVRSHDVDAGN